MGWNFFEGAHGDAANAVLAFAGHKLRGLLAPFGASSSSPPSRQRDLVFAHDRA